MEFSLGSLKCEFSSSENVTDKNLLFTYITPCSLLPKGGGPTYLIGEPGRQIGTCLAQQLFPFYCEIYLFLELVEFGSGPNSPECKNSWVTAHLLEYFISVITYWSFCTKFKVLLLLVFSAELNSFYWVNCMSRIKEATMEGSIFFMNPRSILWLSFTNYRANIYKSLSLWLLYLFINLFQTQNEQSEL